MTQKEQAQLELIATQLSEIKQDITEMKERVLDPDNGLIVQTNQNTWWRKEIEPLVKEIPELIQFKKTTYRLLWIIVTAVVAMAVKMLSM
jgi:hypothetical protein